MNSATYVRRNVSCMTSTHIYTYKYGVICTKHTYICGQGSIFENTHRKLMTLLSFEKDSLLKKRLGVEGELLFIACFSVAFGFHYLHKLFFG